MNATRTIEQWRPVVGFEGRYEVSDHGNVRSLLGKSPQPLKLDGAHPGGYLRVCLRQNGRTWRRTVHRLVLEAFVGPRPAGMECRHLDGNPRNNSVTNLTWGTPSQNNHDMRRHGSSLANRTHCANGHEFTPENTYTSPSAPNRRYCRECMRANTRANYRKHREAQREN